MLDRVEQTPTQISSDPATTTAAGGAAAGDEAADATQSSPSPPSSPRKGLGRATPVAVFATALPVLGSLTVMALGPLMAYWLRDHGIWGVVIFTVLFAILGALALAPTYTTALMAGFAFGFARGFPAVVIGTVGGAVLCYVFARRWAAQRVHETFVDHPKWEVIRRALTEETPGKTLWIVFLMRLSPVLPFGTTNMIMATCGVPMPIYIFGTILGLIPRLGLIALAAAGAENLDLSKGESWWLLAGGLAATGVAIVIMAMMGKRALDRATRSAQIKGAQIKCDSPNQRCPNQR